jgi:hypothetical protein
VEEEECLHRNFGEWKVKAHVNAKSVWVFARGEYSWTYLQYASALRIIHADVRMRSSPGWNSD